MKKRDDPFNKNSIKLPFFEHGYQMMIKNLL